MAKVTELREKLAALGGKALDLLFVPRCVGCGAEGLYLCPQCLAGVRRMEKPYHPGTPRSTGLVPCLTDPVAVDGIFSCFVMEGAVRSAVHQLKYGGLRALASPLGALLAEQAKRSGLATDVLVPVPLHRRRLRERGYNQAELLARETGKVLGVPVEPLAAERVRHSEPQARSGGSEERRANVRGAFQSRRPLDGLRLLRIDDVCTTGATLNACAQALRVAGATFVWGLTVAREL